MRRYLEIPIGTELRVRIWWHGLAALLVVLAPSQLYRGRPVWHLLPNEVPQALAMGCAYLWLALYLHVKGSRLPSGFLARIATVVLASLVCFGAASLAVVGLDGASFSRGIALLSTIAGTLLMLAVSFPELLRRAALPVIALLLLCLLVGIFARRPGAPTTWEQTSAFHTLRINTFDRLVPPQRLRDGGAIAALGDGFLLVTGRGEFYRLDWTASGDSLQSQRLSLPPPVVREAVTEPGVRGRDRFRQRVTDLLIDTTARPVRVFVAHQYWNKSAQCFTLQVSVTELVIPAAASLPEGSGWRRMFETQPCLPRSAGYGGIVTGGKLARDARGRLLLSTGDHGFNGVTGFADPSGSAVAQLPESDYGKILVITPDGGRSVLSSGHRNPQGLAVDDQGLVWESEHGPQGGDELNIIRDGANYGWPLATYGAAYGLDAWPLDTAGEHHTSFTEPAHVWVPSVGISSLIVVRGVAFHRWRGDLLVSSLVGETLYRVRRRGTEVLYVEAMRLNHKIRDLEEGRDGRIVIWTDVGVLLTLSPGVTTPTGEAVYSRCSGCHDNGPLGTGRTAPDLQGILGLQVASRGDFTYSEALRQAGGAWTRERLEAFLENPSAFAPGTTHWLHLSSTLERRIVIDYLGILNRVPASDRITRPDAP